MLFRSFGLCGDGPRAVPVLRGVPVVDDVGPVVRSQVPGDHIPSTGRVRTTWAPVGLLAGVRALVSGEMVRPAEDLPAHPTSVRLDAGVETHVPR